MNTLTDRSIASWDEGDSFGQSLELPDSIATETALPAVSPFWERCIDTLLGLLTNPRGGDIPPNQDSIVAALAWSVFLRERCPTAPPTCIAPEPAGGIILERRVTLPNGADYLTEFTFYNDGSAELTEYRRGKVISLESVPADPLRK